MDHEKGAKSLGPEYFDRIYAENSDPWGFRESAYEREKYARTIASLPRSRYRRCLEVGCSIGELSALLAGRCDELMAIDVHEGSLLLARERNASLSHAHFEVMQFPRHVPAGVFDLLVLSEVAYYWGEEDFVLAQESILTKLEPGGELLLVHYVPLDTDYPMSGDEVHDRYLAMCSLPNAPFKHVKGFREARYRLDVLERI